MARATQAQKVEQGNEEAALEFFEAMLRELPDPRRRQGVRYPLRSVVVVALMAMVCGSDDAESLEAWGEANVDWLKGFLDLPHGPPSQDVYLSVFGALEPKAFSAVARAWADLLRLRRSGPGKHIAIDGKTSRRSFDSASGTPAIHTVSAWMSDAGLVLGQVKTEQKSNEITAIPELLKMLDLRGATVTIDAMGCQTGIAKSIRGGEGQYLLAVKENQPALHAELVSTFAEAEDPRRRAIDETPRPTVSLAEEIEKGHGRVETRTFALCRNLDWVSSRHRWPGLNFVAKVTRTRFTVTTQKTSTETAYYIGSDPLANASSAAHIVRRHWSIENELHWVLDMAFREDEARHRARNTAQNFTVLRHLALNLIKNAPNRRLGVANSRKQAGWDRAFLLDILTAAQERAG